MTTENQYKFISQNIVIYKCNDSIIFVGKLWVLKVSKWIKHIDMYFHHRINAGIWNIKHFTIFTKIYLFTINGIFENNLVDL